MKKLESNYCKYCGKMILSDYIRDSRQGGASYHLNCFIFAIDEEQDNDKE